MPAFLFAAILFNYLKTCVNKSLNKKSRSIRSKVRTINRPFALSTSVQVRRLSRSGSDSCSVVLEMPCIREHQKSTETSEHTKPRRLEQQKKHLRQQIHFTSPKAKRKTIIYPSDPPAPPAW